MSAGVDSLASLRASMIQRPGTQLLLLTIVAAAGAYARASLSPLQEAMRTGLALSDNQMALLQGPALAVPLIASAVPLGLAIDRLSRVRLMAVLTAVTLVAGLLMARASTFSQLMALRCVMGLSATAVNPIGLSLIADLYDADQRGRATMVMAVGQYAAMSAVFALGGALLGSRGDGEDWRWAMLGLMVPVSAILFATVLMREPARRERVLTAPSLLGSLRELWGYRSIVAPLLLGALLLDVALGAVLAWAAPALSRGLELAPQEIGALMAVALVTSGVLGPIIGGVVADHCQRSGGPERTMLAVATLTVLGIPAAFFPLAGSGSMAGVLLVASVTLVGATVVMTTTLITVTIPNELRGLCITLAVAVSALFGVGVAPVAVSLLSSVLGGEGMIGRALVMTVVVVSVLAAMVFGVFRQCANRVAVAGGE